MPESSEESKKLEQDFGKATGMKVVNTPQEQKHQEGQTTYASDQEKEKE